MTSAPHVVRSMLLLVNDEECARDDVIAQRCATATIALSHSHRIHTHTHTHTYTNLHSDGRILAPLN